MDCAAPGSAGWSVDATGPGRGWLSFRCRLIRGEVCCWNCVVSGQRVEAFPAKGVDAEQRRLWPVSPQAATNALALQRRDIAATVAGNISRCTGHRKEDLEQIAMLDITQAARRYSQERGSL